MIKKIFLILAILILPLQSFANNINVAFTIDNNYPIYTLLLIDSILKNNTSNSDYTFFIVENNITAKNKKMMTRHVTQQNQKIEFIHFDTKTIDNGVFYFTFSNRITPIAMARIMLPEILPPEIERVLYLDSDMLATTDIKPLYDTNLGNYHTGMVPNLNIMYYPKYKFLNGYFNSGVILIDVKKWRSQKISKKLINYLEKNSNNFIFDRKNNDEAFLFPDQDLINIVLDGKIKPLEPKWNNQTIRECAFSFDEEGIFHYIGKTKPWSFHKNRIFAHEAYLKNWKQSSLSWYRYYYAFQKIKLEYKNLLKKKIKRFYYFYGKQSPKFLMNL